MSTETPQDTLARLAEIRATAHPALLALVEWQRGEIEKRNDLMIETLDRWTDSLLHYGACEVDWVDNAVCTCGLDALRKRIEEATK